MGIVSNVVKNNTDIDDKVLFVSSLTAAKGAAEAYLAATLVCTTPELRLFFSTQLSQCLLGHAALVDLGVQKGWIDPNLTPMECLNIEINKLDNLYECDK